MTLRDNLDTDHTAESIERVLRARAANFRYIPELESAAELAAKGEELSPSLRMSLGYYSDAKRAADASGMDVSDPAPVRSGNRLANAYNNLANGREDV
ncbi:hypothetical protein N4G69_22195 [Streptomyces mirabilis]|uniref:hypothetical protein n=1 Tax=Streptomyces mirabilis TaxID=68239 RepID=UPI0021BE04B5|nr:hypothetical protein [Streptomyces mirabilis]MCT9108310.1 hypothetical protein [Streptomyces mirabilis]